MTGSTESVELVVPARADVGEGPLWDHRCGLLYWVDITPGHLHSLDPATGATTKTEYGQALGAVALRAAGGLVLALRRGLAFLGADGGQPRPSHDLNADHPQRLLNDCACDRAGRLWVDRVADDPEPGSSSVYRVSAEDGVTEVITGATLANGIDWSPDDRTMYFVDSMEHVVWAYDFDPIAGEPSGRRTFVRTDPELGLPDGLTVDEDGFVWVAYWGGWCVRRYTPDGRQDRVIELPVAQVSSVAFGGDRLEELYITTAAADLSLTDLADQPLAGSLFRHRPGVRGFPAAAFVG